LIGIERTPKKTGGVKNAAGLNEFVILGLFSDLFYVAASRPAKSPRMSVTFTLGAPLRQWT